MVAPPAANRWSRLRSCCPLLVTVVVAGIDLARYVAMHTAADAASREATRYASAVGPSGESPPRYVNCAGIRAAAVEAAPILDLSAPPPS